MPEGACHKQLDYLEGGWSTSDSDGASHRRCPRACYRHGSCGTCTREQCMSTGMEKRFCLGRPNSHCCRQSLLAFSQAKRHIPCGTSTLNNVTFANANYSCDLIQQQPSRLASATSGNQVPDAVARGVTQETRRSHNRHLQEVFDARNNRQQQCAY